MRQVPVYSVSVIDINDRVSLSQCDVSWRHSHASRYVIRGWPADIGCWNYRCRVFDWQRRDGVTRN